MKKKFFSSLIVCAFILLCGLFYGCSGDRYSGVRMDAKFSYSESQVVGTVQRDGLYGVRVKTANSVFDYYSQTNLYVFYILNANATAAANIEVNFANAPGDFNFGAYFNFDNPIAKAQGGGEYSGTTYTKNIVFFDAGTTNLTAYSNEGNKKTTISIEVVKVASEVSFYNNNMALTKTVGSTLDLTPSKVLSLYPQNSSLTNVKYDFGYYDENTSEFVSFDDAERNTSWTFNVQNLWSIGLDYNHATKTLIVDANPSVTEVVVKAIYDNPLEDEDICCYTTIKLVEPIENFGVYYGKQFSDIFSGNAIDESKKVTTLQNLIVNMENLNYVDVILFAKSNGEEIEFNFDESSINLPVYFNKTANLEYKNAMFGTCDNASDATYALAYYKIIASKKTTENSRYGTEGIFNLNSLANYKNYEVDNYPISTTVQIKNDALVKNYSVNGVYVDNTLFTGNIYNANVYINDVSNGTGLYVDVINPVSVLKENAKFKVSLYAGTSEADKIAYSDVASYFTLRKDYNGSKTNVNLTETTQFEKQTTLYVQANTSTGLLTVGQTYYLVLTSLQPSGDNFVGRFEEDELAAYKAIATIKLNVVQGLTSVDGYEYATQNYMVDNLTGGFVKFDYTNSTKLKYSEESDYFYVLIDESISDSESNRNLITPLVFDDETNSYYKLVYNTNGKMYYSLKEDSWFRVVDEEKQWYDVDNNKFYKQVGGATQIVDEEVIVNKVFVEENCYYIQTEEASAYFVNNHFVNAYVNDENIGLKYNNNYSKWYKEVGEVTSYYDADQQKFYRLVNASEPDVATNRSYDGDKSYITISEDVVKLDLSSGFDANLNLYSFPSSANIENLEVTSSNVNVVTFEFEKDENLYDIKNKLKLIPQSVGEATIQVSIPNLNKTYAIAVNVYKPLTDMFITLNSTSFSSGIGYCKLDNSVNKNLNLAIVAYGKTIGLNMQTLPINASEYSITYNLYQAEKVLDANTNEYVYLKSVDAETGLEILKSSYTKMFDGTATNSSGVISDSNAIVFNCVTNTFIFPEASSVGNIYAVEITLTNLDGTYITRTMFLESYSPVESIVSTLDKKQLYTPNTIAYSLKTAAHLNEVVTTSFAEKSADPTVIGIKVDVNKNSAQAATFNFDNYGTLRVIFGSDSEAFTLKNGVLTNLENKNILIPISASKDGEGYFWFKLNENYYYNKNNGVIFLSFEIEEFSNIFSRSVAIYVKDAVAASRLVSNSPEQLYFKLGLTEDKNYNVEVSPNNVYDKTLYVKTFEVVEVKTTNILGEEVIKDYYVETFVEGLPSGSAEAVLTQTEENSVIYNLKVSSKRAGNSVIVVMPEDKIISRAQYDSWGNKAYVSVGVLNQDEYVPNFYYIYTGVTYEITEEFEEGTTYYILATNVNELLNIWQNYLEIYVSVADGIKVPYQISTIDELKEVSESSESVTRNYVLVSNLIWDTLENWQPIGNYYEENVSAENYVKGKYYYKNLSGNYVLDYGNSFDEEHLPYYSYGFNGKFSGKFTLKTIHTGEITNYYLISNIAYVTNIDCENALAQGLFSFLGEKAVVEDVSVSYYFYQPKITNFFVFGGVAGVNHGTIKNAKVGYNNFAFEFDNGGIFGGVTGINTGVVENENSSNIGVSGSVNISIKTQDVSEPVGKEIIGIVEEDINTNNVIIGGIIGLNENTLIGSFSIEGDIKLSFNEDGFDSSLNLEVTKNETLFNLAYITTSVGGAVGVNAGYISNLAIQGKITAENCNNVGGLVGTTKYNSKFNAEEEEIDGEEYLTEYSVYACYSIATVTGNENVGGAVGNIEGENTEKTVKMYFVSAENYAGVYKLNKADRTFVIGNKHVGGFAGMVNYANIEYCYVVSYFDSVEFNAENYNKFSNYDVYAKHSYVAGFIANIENSKITNSSSFVNCCTNTSAGIFLADFDENTQITDVFARGFLNTTPTYIYPINIRGAGYYNYYYWSGAIQHAEKYYASGVETTFAGVNWEDNGFVINELVNDGLPYLTITIGTNTMPLYATTPVNVSLAAKDVEVTDKYFSYIKYDNSSIILFYNIDADNKYENLKNTIQNLNVVKLFDIANLQVEPATHKTYKLDIASDKPQIVNVLNNGDLVILGEGSAIITAYSKLNENYNASITIVVKYGLNNIELYNNVSYTVKTDESEIETLKSRSLTMYVQKDYIREVPVGVDGSEKTTVELKSMSGVGFRFKITENGHEKAVNVGGTIERQSITLSEILTSYASSSISDILKINGRSWDYDAESGAYYIDVPTDVNPILYPEIAIDDVYLKIGYVPYIQTYFNSVFRTISLDRFTGEFTYNIKHGATEIKAENNIDNILKFTQLQTQTFTITMYTDFEDDFIVSTISEVEYDTYNDSNILDVLNNNPSTEIGPDNLLNIMQSNLVKNYNGTKLESVSITLTLNYKDKINAIEKDKIYKFTFNAHSNSQIEYVLGVVLLSQDKINQVYGTVYANLTDFPQTPEQSNCIYNGIVGTISLEVYPYISNYSKMRVSYSSSSTYPMLLTQLSYNIAGNDAEKLSYYPNSGSVTNGNEYLILEKSSGQDTYLLNNTGLYSYSKIYFVSMLVSSYVPNNTSYTINVEFLSRQNNIVASYSFNIKTIAKPTINLSFDENLYSSVDNFYYLPLNTKNELDVAIDNYDGDITWEVSCADWPSDVPLDSRVVNAFTPYIENGKYYVNIMNYVGKNQDNVFDSNLLGHVISIKGSFVDNRIYYEASIKILVTLFTVTSVLPQGVNKGFMTLPLSTTTPLLTTVEAYYDDALVNKEDNWYSYLYEEWKTIVSDKGTVYNALVACGYEIEEYFINYIVQLQNAITKTDYNFNDLYRNTAYTDGENPPPPYVKKSGVWFYNDLAGESGYLEILGSNKRDYNNSTFGFEMYNGYPAVYGYQVDINSSLSLKVKLAYTNCKDRNGLGETANGVPNVLNYDISATNATYKYRFDFNKDFILNFTYKTDLINAIPVSTEEEFLNMEEGKDYRLVSDLILENYTPISTKINSFDGNNYTIYITSFGFNAIESSTSTNANNSCVLGLFNTLSENSVLYNVKVFYTNRFVSIEKIGDRKTVTPNVNGEMVANLTSYNTCSFGGIVGTNKGVLTNCEVSGSARIILNYDINNGVIGSGINGGLVATNDENGYITNSKVKNFTLTCYGETGGLVYENKGKIVSSYFAQSTIDNLSSSTTGGFVNVNSGKVHECYVEGFRLNTDNDIRNKGLGIQSKGSISGFVYNNFGVISDCYTNISLSSSTSLAGFVYADTNTSEISRSYTICYKSPTDNSTVAYIFAGATNYTNVVINGKLTNCYYLSGTGNWVENFTWESDEEDKRATGLDAGKFTTQSFANFDLSLSYETAKYPNGSEYKYVDGYTWVTIEGKPVLTSTLVDTISQREYKGKSKTYLEPVNYFSSTGTVTATVIISGITKTYYYNNPDNKYYDASVERDDEDLVCLVTEETGQTLEYKYYIKLTSDDVTINELTINYVWDAENSTWKFDNAYTDSKILDFKVQDNNGNYHNSFEEDNNFRANDMIVVSYDENNLISNIRYCVLDSASYYYDDFVVNVSDKVGTRTNPQIIYDFDSFNYYLSAATAGNFYRLTKDIDFRYRFARTTLAKFQGVLIGNYMELNRIAISYLNNNAQTGEASGLNDTLETFGLFSEISVDTNNISGLKTTMMFNLTLNIVEILSNSHSFVGALAGKVTPVGGCSVVLNNIAVYGYNGNRGFVQGKNAVGGLVGYVDGSVSLKDITCGVNVNATKEMNANVPSKDYLIYTGADNNKKNYSSISYAGGVIGVFNASKITKDAAKKNYNANNISITESISVIGGVVGTAFGFVGKETIVNYVNVVVQNKENNFLKSLSFAGGLIGENRGKIVSSSITYGSAENYNSVNIATSEFVERDYFYNNSVANRSLAVGGLVGLNNGGVISNCISTINVRNKYALSAGGAVGVMVAGTLENVIASGSVIAEINVGGLIGLLEHENIFTDSFNGDVYQASIDSHHDFIGTVIKNCVASNNWLARDFNYYKNTMLAGSKPVGGFIGLIAYPSGIADNNSDEKLNYNDVVIFEGNNYYNSTLYSSSAATKVSLYLKAAYYAHADTATNLDEATIYNIENVWPYSTREFYYENSLKNVYYTIKSDNAPNVETVNPKVANVYTISSSLNIDNTNDMYTRIDLSNQSVWTEVYSGGVLTRPAAEGWYTWLTNHFGNIYTYNSATDEFVQVAKPGTGLDIEVTTALTNYYFIGKVTVTGGNTKLEAPSLNEIYSTQLYEIGTNAEALTFIAVDSNNLGQGNLIYSDEDGLANIKAIWLNGVMYEKLTFTLNKPNHYASANLSSNPYQFANGIKVTKIAFTYTSGEDIFDNPQYTITNIMITYKYSLSGNSYIYTTTTNAGAKEKKTSLNILSKKLIFNSFDNGYWNFAENFYLNNDYVNTNKYPQNIEHSTIHVWTDDNIRATSFKDTDLSDGLTIETPEELALFAYKVNSGEYDYVNAHVELSNDIDLSGKYWKPIGNSAGGFDYVFKGTFDGKGHSIKYAVVNDNSFGGESVFGNGIFCGVFGVICGATICNLTTVGGNISGYSAGGVVGRVINSATIYNVVNKNDVLASCYGGGVIGSTHRVDALSSDNYLLVSDLINYGRITYNSDSNYNSEYQVSIGGIIGYTSGTIIVNNLNFYEAGKYDYEEQYGLINNGSISVTNNKTNYFGSSPQAWEIDVGGIGGYVVNGELNNVEKIVNNGKISVTTNGHFVNIGGIFGITNSNSSSSDIGNEESGEIKGKVNNKGNIDVTYKNSLIIANTTNIARRFAEANIGGIVGCSSNRRVSYAGNDASIDVLITTTTFAHVGVGGIAGNLYYSNTGTEKTQTIDQCYNAGTISVLTISEETSVGVGGIVGFANVSDGRTNKNENIDDKKISNCYNAGDVKSDGNSQLFMGGILGSGYVYDASTYDPTEDAKRYVYNLNSDASKIKRVSVDNCLNYGQVFSTNYGKARNSIGAIIGLSKVNEIEYVVTAANYYLSGSSYSGKTMFTGTNYYTTNDESDMYVSEPDEVGHCESKLSTTLKTRVNSTNSIYNGWVTTIWQQEFDTWYPTLINNKTYFLWSEKQEKTNQEKGYYLVKTAEELAYIADQINTGILDSSNVYIQLKNSIDLAGRYWQPIGTEQYAFKGTFNGNGYSIKNLTIDGNSVKTFTSDGTTTYAGLFGVCLDATICNVGLENPIIQNVDYAGAVVYKATNSRIEKVYTTNENGKDARIIANIGVGGIAYMLVDCIPSDSNNNLGGLYASFNNIPLYNNKKLTEDFDNDKLLVYSQTGGLVAILQNSKIENCYNNSNGNIAGLDSDSVIKATTKEEFTEHHWEKILIVGFINNTSTLVNVFNLARVTLNGNIEAGFNSLINSESLINSGNAFPIQVEPVFENLSPIDGVNLKDIWTNEYSLNANDYTDYPYLRGLGKEWKNTESETLKNIVYGVNGEDVTTAEDKLQVYINEQRISTLVKVLDPQLSFVTAEQQHFVYLISTAEELVWLANNVNNGSLSTTDCEFILLKDIDLAGKFWTPIGISSAYAFQGIFNFNGHVISNLTIDAENFAYGGLFGYASNAYIANGYIRNAFIKVVNNDDKANVYVGTVVGKGYNTTIKNIKVQARIATFASSSTFVGGIIGCLTGTRDYLISNVSVVGSNTTSIDLGSYKPYVVEDSVFNKWGSDAKIQENTIDIGAFSSGGNVYCGGVIGYMSGYVLEEDSNVYLLEQATNTADIAAVTASDASIVYLGGVLGYGLEEVTLNIIKNSGKLKACAASRYDILGGIVGYMYNGKILNAYFKGYLECCQNPSVISYVGGIVGDFENYGIIGSSINNGEIYSNENYSNFAAVGGIIGRAYDHYFNEDSMSIYKYSINGFTKSIGVVEYSQAVQIELDLLINSGDENKINEYKEKTVYEDDGVSGDGIYAVFFRADEGSVFNYVSDNRLIFLEDIWSTTSGLKVSHIYLVGCQTSFNKDTNNLSSDGVLIDSLNVEIRYTSGGYSEGDKIKYAIIDANGNYFIKEVDIVGLTGNAFSLKDQIETNASFSYNEDDLIIIYVTLIKAE